MSNKWNFYDILEIIVDFAFAVDIVINFLSAYEEQSNQMRVIVDYKMIAINYIKGWFFFDFIAILPI